MRAFLCIAALVYFPLPFVKMKRTKKNNELTKKNGVFLQNIKTKTIFSNVSFYKTHIHTGMLFSNHSLLRILSISVQFNYPLNRLHINCCIKMLQQQKIKLKLMIAYIICSSNAVELICMFYYVYNIIKWFDRNCGGCIT